MTDKRKMRFLVIGGDKRQAYIAYYLKKAGYGVETFGVYDLKITENRPGNSAYKADSKKNWCKLLEEADMILGPVPFTRDGKHIHTEITDERITIIDFLHKIRKEQLLLGGSFSEELKKRFTSFGLSVWDYMKQEEVTSYFALLTAEGAVAEAIYHSPYSLSDSKCLVLGYGYCGSAIAKVCKALGAEVYVGVRREEACYLANANNFHGFLLTDLENIIQDFSYLFNTIPSLILRGELLGKIPKDSVIIDIASAPGGIDYEYAQKQHLNARLLLGIPGKTAPKSSAKKLTEVIIKRVEER